MLKSAIQKILRSANEPDPLLLITLEKNASRVLHIMVLKSLSEFKITPTEWIILAEIQKNETGIAPLMLSKNLNLKPSFMASYLKKFEKKQILKFTTNPEDKRFKTAVLTNKGLGLINSATDGVEKVVSKIFEGVSPRDLEGFESILNHIVSRK